MASRCSMHACRACGLPFARKPPRFSSRLLTRNPSLIPSAQERSAGQTPPQRTVPPAPHSSAIVMELIEPPSAKATAEDQPCIGEFGAMRLNDLTGYRGLAAPLREPTPTRSSASRVDSAGSRAMARGQRLANPWRWRPCAGGWHWVPGGPLPEPPFPFPLPPRSLRSLRSP